MSKWPCATIKEIAKVKGGKRLPAGCEFADSLTLFPYLRVTNMVNSTIKNEIVYVKPEIEPIIRNYKISKNDIYVTIAGTLGNFGTIPNSYDNAQLTENAAKITDINNAKYDKIYLVYSFNSDYVQKQIKKEIGIG
ncbi:MAG: restriction endonuclease subunit S, partial [Candidatus Auribacterota bacterium]|nr:restriction endonuclease subunit S [Candidatus Auribacterota bacterium]